MSKVFEFIFHPKKNPNYEKLEKSCLYDALMISLFVYPIFALAIGVFEVIPIYGRNPMGTPLF